MTALSLLLIAALPVSAQFTVPDVPPLKLELNQEAAERYKALLRARPR